jgi:flagellar motor switch protein FliM
VPPNEVVVVVGFEMKMGNRAGTMNLCIPYNVIEPVMESLSAQSWFNTSKAAGREEVQQKVTGSLSRAGLTVTGVLAETTISLDDLKNLAVGDIILTDKAVSDPLVLAVEGEKKFLCSVGRFKQNRAVQIHRPIKAGDRV